jgi:hypothetical protein
LASLAQVLTPELGRIRIGKEGSRNAQPLSSSTFGNFPDQSIRNQPMKSMQSMAIFPVPRAICWTDYKTVLK